MAQNALYDAEDDLGVGGLVKDGSCASGTAGGRHAWMVPHRKQDDRGGMQCGLGSELPADVVPAQAPQHDVQQDDVRALLLGKRNACEAVGDGENSVTSPFEEITAKKEYERVVIDAENGGRADGRRVVRQEAAPAVLARDIVYCVTLFFLHGNRDAAVGTDDGSVHGFVLAPARSLTLWSPYYSSIEGVPATTWY